jgi:hypothetical protein
VPERIYVSKAEKIMTLKLLRTDLLTPVLNYNAPGDFRLIHHHSENPSALKNVIKHLY